MFMPFAVHRAVVLTVLLAVFSPTAFGLLPTSVATPLDVPSDPMATPASDDDPMYPVSELDPLTRSTADAVVRLDDRHLTLKNPSEATYAVRRVVTVLTPEGREEAFLSVRYGQFREIEAFDGLLRDADGNVIRDMESEDRKDVSASGGSTLATDSRYRYAQLSHSSYPYTVELEYKVDFNGYFILPTWYPQGRPDVPVVEAAFKVTHPPELPVRYQVRNADMDMERVNEKGEPSIIWRMRDVPTKTRRILTPGWRHRGPALHLAPSRFSIAGRRGALHSWQDLGAWYYSLYDERQTLPNDLKRAVDDILARSPSKRETIQAFYTYMQDRTRYISVQLGLGGWQPFSTEYVHERGYGDCKALTNYLWAMLRYAKIDAYPAVIERGLSPGPFLADFPSHQFNHVVLAVPTEQDTLWIEATSQILPYDEVHPGIANREALLLSADGGTLVRTPASTAADNVRSRRTDVTLTASGDATGTTTTTRTGATTYEPRYRLSDATPEETQSYVQRRYDAPNVSVKSVDVKGLETRSPTLEVTAQAHFPQLASSMGSRLFVPSTLMGRSRSVPPEATSDRSFPYTIRRYPITLIDTTNVRTPDGYTLEAQPDSVSLTTSFGAYHAHVEPTDDGFRHVRRLTFTRTEIPTDAYEDFRTFYQTRTRHERNQIVLVKK